jgi:nitroreductase
MSTQTFDTSVTDRLLSTTRAVRRRLDLDRPVPEDVVLDCLRLAIQAPTGSNAQGWRWLVVTDPAKRAALAQIYREAGADYLRSAAGRAEGQTRRVYDSAVYLTDILDRVPVHVIACVEGRADQGPNVLSASLYGSVIPAVWSFMLALRSRGLGSVFTTLHLIREEEAASLLGIPYEKVTQVALLPVAYTVGDEFKPASRPAVETITYWDSWGTPR